MRGGSGQHFPFLQRFPDQTKVIIFEIAQTAVNQLELQEEVALARSPFSNSATDKPRPAASALCQHH